MRGGEAAGGDARHARGGAVIRRRFTLGEVMIVVVLLCLATVIGLRLTWEDDEAMARAAVRPGRLTFRTQVVVDGRVRTIELHYRTDERGIIVADGAQVDR